MEFVGLVTSSHIMQDPLWVTHEISDAEKLFEQSGEDAGNSLVILQDPKMIKWMNVYVPIDEQLVSAPLPMDFWFSRSFRCEMRSLLSTEMLGSSFADVTGGHVEELSSLVNVAVHIRRGDVGKSDSLRYLDNAYYLNVLHGLLNAVLSWRKHAKVAIHIFSESSSDEPFDEFQAFNSFPAVSVSLHLDGDLKTAWSSFVHADIFVMSKSSFSFVPALYRNLGECNSICSSEFAAQLTIYAPFWHSPLQEWILADESLFERSFSQAAVDILSKQILVKLQDNRVQ